MVKQSHITLVPTGGLANRLKAIHAGISLAEHIKATLRIIWFADWGLRCPFSQLFQPLTLPNVEFVEASVRDFLLYDRPRKKNLFIPRLFQRMKFDDCLYEEDTATCLKSNFDFAAWACGRNVYIAGWDNFYGEKSDKYHLFAPRAEIQKQIEDVTQHFGEHCVGIHIRRTDNVEAIRQSPTELFVQRMQSEIARNSNTKFYLATDSQADKALIINTFPDRVIVNPRQADRESVAGMQDAVRELFLLSKTRYIIGSFHSSYSATAAEIGGIRCELIQKIPNFVA